MQKLELFELREAFLSQSTVLCFNGPFTRGLIEEIGNALRNYLSTEQASANSVMDVFSVYIEMTQNIRHYSVAKGYGDIDSSAIVTISKTTDGGYIVRAGNIVELADGRQLADRVAELAPLDSAQLKARYKEQLRKPRDETADTGAGLGLIDMARKSRKPITCSLREFDNERGFFSLEATI